MSEVLINTIIGTGGLIIGAIITSIASTYKAKQKIKEIEMNYTYKLRENYLSNARKYTDYIYVPINTSLSYLINSYYEFRSNIDFKNNSVSKIKEEFFVQGCNDYLNKINQQKDNGADAFLTSELEEKLRSFNNFLMQSILSDKPLYKVIISYNFRFPFFDNSTEDYFVTKRNIIAPLRNISVYIPGVRFSYRNEELLGAPVTSREFEEKFFNDSKILKFYIKEVTLGSHNPQMT